MAPDDRLRSRRAVGVEPAVRAEGAVGAARTAGLARAVGAERGVRAERALGAALVAFGLAGIALIVLGLATLGRLDAEGRPAGPSGADPATELRSTLAASEAALREAAVSSRSAGAGLVEAADAAGAAGSLTTDLATTMRSLGAALRITILGSQPFAPIAPAFDAVADQAAALAGDLEAVRTTVRAGADDLDALADRVADLGERVGRLRGTVDAATLEGLESLRLFAAALLAWLAVPAIASVWLGVRRLRDSSGRRRVDPIAPGAAFEA